MRVEGRYGYEVCLKIRLAKSSLVLYLGFEGSVAVHPSVRGSQRLQQQSCGSMSDVGHSALIRMPGQKY